MIHVTGWFTVHTVVASGVGPHTLTVLSSLADTKI